jgi:hypothetical protein
MIDESVRRYIVMCTLVLAARMAALICAPKSLGCTWIVTLLLVGMTPPSAPVPGARPPSAVGVSPSSPGTSGPPLVASPLLPAGCFRSAVLQALAVATKVAKARQSQRFCTGLP